MRKQHSLNIIIVAHPDDECLFFSSLMLMDKENKTWVVCVTNGDADGQGRQRKQHFEKACEELGAERTFWLNFEDNFEEPLDILKLNHALLEIERQNKKAFKENDIKIYTHGPLGEYMHPHHQDVCYAVYRCFADKYPVSSPAYNCFPDETFHLDQSAFEKKQRILSETYGNETKRFINLVPCTSSEGFKSFSIKEVSHLYKVLRQGEEIESEVLEDYSWLKEFIREKVKTGNKRLF